MLDITLATEFVPGTNLKGEVSGANWLFLLPQIDLDSVVCFGLPAASSLVALARLTGSVVVFTEGAARQQLDDLVHKYGLANVRPLIDTQSLSDASVALALIATSDALASFGKDSGLLAELQRILKHDGYLYVEKPGLIGGKRDQAAIGRLVKALGVPQRFWLTPMSGEMHTAIAQQDQATGRYFLQHGLTSRSINLGVLKRAIRARGGAARADRQGAQVSAAPKSPAMRRGIKASIKGAARTRLVSVYHRIQSVFDGVEQHLNQSAVLGELTRRYGVLVRRGSTERIYGPPRYLCVIAQAAGKDIGAYRWGLSARGEYSSRKVLIFLFERASHEPTYIVKMTRDPALNERLENEHRALKYLAEQGIGDAETLPQIAFFGHHNRLAVVGETIVKGMPFEQQSSGSANCPYLHNAAGWLTDLSAATADYSLATPAQAAAVLGRLFERFAAIYPLAPAHKRFMTELLATMGRSTSRFPLVFQHGDPGTWNIWVTPTGRTAFLDWEAAEVHGMPLWDLFYFIRTYGAWASRATISGDVSKGFGDQFLTPSPFQTLMIERTARYCEQVGLAAELIEPLFYTCWMHRGLKEATRLTSSTLARGHYFNVLCESIDRRAALQALFAPMSTLAR